MKNKKWIMSFLEFILLGILCAGIVGCGSKTKSTKDYRREQIRLNADNKREELKFIAGEYKGILYLDESMIKGQNISFSMDIKDIPVPEEGQVDTVIIPKLAGHFRLNFGKSSDGIKDDYISFSLQQAEYDRKRKKLNVVAVNEKYKDLILELEQTEHGFKGSWSAPGSSSAGQLKLISNKEINDGNENSRDEVGQFSSSLNGTYPGIVYWNQYSSYQLARITLNTIKNSPEGFGISAMVRLFFGELSTTEYLTYHFDDVEFNPFNGQLTIKSPQSGVSFIGNYQNGRINGQWYSDYAGLMGAIEFDKKKTPMNLSAFKKFGPLLGTYHGEIKNLHPDVQLPKNVMLTFLTSEDSTRNNGISISGKMRIYLGDFNSLEYIELPFINIEFDFFSRRITAKTTGNYDFIFKGVVLPDGIKGDLDYGILGKVAEFDAKKFTN